MSKFLAAFLFLCYVAGSCLAQNAYYDAKVLIENGWVRFSELTTKKEEILINKQNAEAALSLLFKYLPDADKRQVENETDPVKRFQLYQAAFANNPFINIAGTVQDHPLHELTSSARAAAENTLGSTANMDISTIADGLAKFLVKRTKQELATTFFEKFSDALENEKDLQKIFPSTYSILKVLGSEVYNYQVYLSSLREAFEFDLENFFANGFAWTKSKQGVLIGELKQSSHAKIYAGIKSALFVGRELDRGEHPGSVLNSLTLLHNPKTKNETDSINFSTLDANLFPVLKTVNLFSQSVRSNAGANYWITEKEFTSFNNADFLRSYFGFLYQQLMQDPVRFQRGTSETVLLSDLLKNMGAQVNELQTIVQLFKAQTASIEKHIALIKEAPLRKGSDYASIVRDLSGIMLAAGNSKLLSGTVIFKGSEMITFYSEHVSALWAHIETQSYTSAIFDAYIMLDSAFRKSPNRGTLKSFLKYGTFMAAVASATNSDEVEAAIEAVALPPGSASIKRKTKSNISLNAFVGLSPGYEWKSGNLSNGRATLAVAAPVGIAFSKGWYHDHADQNKYTERGSMSFFISLIDLGAVTAYRFNASNEAALPELTLSNIFAPGLYCIYGFPKSPVSAGLGAQMGPQLRKINDVSATINSDISYSAKAFIAIDIPLLNFHTKSR
jgi:hypothetical protein